MRTILHAGCGSDELLHRLDRFRDDPANARRLAHGLDGMVAVVGPHAFCYLRHPYLVMPRGLYALRATMTSRTTVPPAGCSKSRMGSHSIGSPMRGYRTTT